MPSAVICLVVRREGSLYYTARDGIWCWVGGEFLSHAPCLNLSGSASGQESLTRPALAFVSLFDFWGVSIARPVPGSVSTKSRGGGTFFLQATCCNLFRDSTGVEPLLHLRCYNLP